MRKSILLAVLSLVAIVAVACGGGNAANKGNTPAKGNAGGNAAACTGGGDTGVTTGGGDTSGSAAKSDAYALYKKEGRVWKHKSVSKMGDMPENVSFTQWTVKSVAADHAMVEMAMFDADGKPNEWVKPSESKIEFATATGTTGDAPKVETKEESIEVKAGKFDCIVTETEAAGMKTKSWSSKKYPGLLVKSVTSGEMAGVGKSETTMELVEFKE